MYIDVERNLGHTDETIVMISYPKIGSPNCSWNRRRAEGTHVIPRPLEELRLTGLASTARPFVPAASGGQRNSDKPPATAPPANFNRQSSAFISFIRRVTGL